MSWWSWVLLGAALGYLAWRMFWVAIDWRSEGTFWRDALEPLCNDRELEKMLKPHKTTPSVSRSTVFVRALKTELSSISKRGR